MAVDREQRTRALRYKRPALASMGYEHIQRELEEIVEACDDVAWFAGDIDTLTEALDGSDEEAHEFMLSCSDLSAKAGLLLEQLYEVGGWDSDSMSRQYDDCTVALIGNRYGSTVMRNTVKRRIGGRLANFVCFNIGQLSETTDEVEALADEYDHRGRDGALCVTLGGPPAKAHPYMAGPCIAPNFRRCTWPAYGGYSVHSP